MAVTVDTWVYNWISQQDGKKSTLVNKILKQYIIDLSDNSKPIGPQIPDKKNKMIHPETKDIVQVGALDIETEILFAKSGYVMHEYGA